MMNYLRLKQLNVSVGDELIHRHTLHTWTVTDTPATHKGYYCGTREDGREGFMNDTDPVWKMYVRTFGELTPEKQGELLLAHHRGQPIQLFSCSEEWIDCDDPLFDDSFAYRVANVDVAPECTFFYKFDCGITFDGMSMPVFSNDPAVRKPYKVELDAEVIQGSHKIKTYSVSVIDTDTGEKVPATIDPRHQAFIDAVEFILDGLGIEGPDYKIDPEDEFLDVANSNFVRDLITRLADVLKEHSYA